MSELPTTFRGCKVLFTYHFKNSRELIALADPQTKTIYIRPDYSLLTPYTLTQILEHEFKHLQGLAHSKSQETWDPPDCGGTGIGLETGYPPVIGTCPHCQGIGWVAIDKEEER